MVTSREVENPTSKSKISQPNPFTNLNGHPVDKLSKYPQFGEFGLTSVEHETHEKYFYGTEHWNYFSNDDDLGPVILSLKQENVNGRDQG